MREQPGGKTTKNFLFLIVAPLSDYLHTNYNVRQNLILGVRTVVCLLMIKAEIMTVCNLLYKTIKLYNN